MPVRRKVFRIEMMSPIGAPEAALPRGAVPALHHQEFMTELRALRDRIELRSGEVTADAVGCNGLRTLKDETNTIHRTIERTRQEIASLHAGGFSGNGGGRAAEELDAVVADAERATQSVLAAAEDISCAAKRLDASAVRAQDRELAHDILDHLVRIFESCNFQDLSGQRITKVLATLKFVEDHVARMMGIWGGIQTFEELPAPAAAAGTSDGKTMHGPKLNGDRGHASQADIDMLFGSD